MTPDMEEREALSASPVGEGLGASASPIPTEQAGGPVVGWQPIETAPKDGTPILITRPTDFDREERFHVVRWAEHPHFEDKCWVVHDGKNDHALRGPDPTAWAALSAPSTTSTAEQVEPCGGCGETDPAKRCIGCLHDFGSPIAPTPGEGDAPVAWIDPYCLRLMHEKGEPRATVYPKGSTTGEGSTQPLYTRPTPATPEGLRPLCEALRARLDLARRVNAEAEYTISEDEMRAILAALQPQAQGGGE